MYRLTAAGEQKRRELLPPFDFEALYPSLPSEGVRCRCTHCGAEFEDATPGGSCGRCGLAVAAI